MEKTVCPASTDAIAEEMDLAFYEELYWGAIAARSDCLDHQLDQIRKENPYV